MTQRIPKIMKMTPEHRTLLNAIAYLGAMAAQYRRDVNGSLNYSREFQLQMYYESGHTVLIEHVYEKFIN